MSFRGKPVMVSWNVHCFSGYRHCTLISCLQEGSLRTADVSPCSLPLGDGLRGGTSATQRQKFHTDDVNQCLHNKSGSHGVPNANLFNFTFLLVNFNKVLCSSANDLQKNSNASKFWRRLYSSNIDCFVRDSSHLYLTFVAFCLLSVIRKQYLKQWNYSVDQLVLLTGFRTDFASSKWNFCPWVADVFPRKTSLSGDEWGETSAVRRLTRGLIVCCM